MLAWEWPCPDDCYYWNGYDCILIGECGVGDPCPDGGYCIACMCMDCISDSDCDGVCVDNECVDCRENQNCPTCYDCENNDCVSKWTASPAISGASIEKNPSGLIWFHINDECILTAKGHDYDSCRGVQQPEDNIRLDLTEWSSRHLLEHTGESVIWKSSEPTEGDTITATIKDDPDSPDGTNTDDSDVVTAAITLKAYEAKGVLTVNRSDGTSDTVVVTETGTPSGSFGGNLNDSESVESELSGDCEDDDDYDYKFFEPSEPYVRAQWTLATNPSGANIGTNVIRIHTTASVSGTLSCSVSDGDWDLGGCPVSISVSGGFGPLSVTISPDLDTSSDSCEAQAAIAFGFNSDIHGSRLGGNAPKLEQSSGDGCGDFDLPFSYNPNGQYYSGIEGQSIEAAARAGGKIECRGTQWFTFNGLLCHVNQNNSNASMSSAGSVTYTISSPEIISP